MERLNRRRTALLYQLASQRKSPKKSNELWENLGKLKVGESLWITSAEAKSYYKTEMSQTIYKNCKKSSYLGRFKVKRYLDKGWIIVRTAKGVPPDLPK